MFDKLKRHDLVFFTNNVCKIFNSEYTPNYQSDIDCSTFCTIASKYPRKFVCPISVLKYIYNLLYSRGLVSLGGLRVRWK